MFKRSFLGDIALALGIIYCMSACSDDKNCDDININTCDETGTKLITGCSAGEIYYVDCKALSATALCSEAIGCYEPCTVENEEKHVCIDHTADTDYCELKTISGECSNIPPEQRPNGYKDAKCTRDKASGTLYWRLGTEESCFRNSTSACCLEAGKRCDAGFSDTCDEDTNTAIYCNCELYNKDVDFLVKHKDCSAEGPGYHCEYGKCVSGE